MLFFKTFNDQNKIKLKEYDLRKREETTIMTTSYENKKLTNVVFLEDLNDKKFVNHELEDGELGKLLICTIYKNDSRCIMYLRHFVRGSNNHYYYKIDTTNNGILKQTVGLYPYVMRNPQSYGLDIKLNENERLIFMSKD